MTTGCYTRTRAAAVRQPQPPVEFSHFVIVVAIAFLSVTAIMVGRGRRCFLEDQRAMTVRVAVRPTILQIVRQQRMPSGVAFLRLNQQRCIS